jgi:uncharacterized RDD family membrane protein YckC
VTYPNVLRRYLATLLDLLAIWLVLFAVSRLPFAPQSTAASGAILFGLLFLYEPLMTAYFCTLGQAAMRTRVRDERSLGRIGLSQAFSRLIIKYLLGAISVLTVPAHKRRQGLHDLLTGTIVIEARDAITAQPAVARQ